MSVPYGITNLRECVVSDIRLALAFVDKRFVGPATSSVADVVSGGGVGTSRWGAAAAELVLQLDRDRGNERGPNIVVVGGTARDPRVGS